VAIAAYLGQGGAFDQAMTDFAETYADQNASDFKGFEAAVKKGRLKSVTGL